MQDESKMLCARCQMTSQNIMYILAFIFAMAIGFLIPCGVFAESFDTNVRVDDGGTFIQTSPSIAADNQGNVYVVWQDNRRGQLDIYCAKSVNGGETFGASLLVQDDTYAGSSDQKAPAMAIDRNGVLYVVWQDERNGNWDIYFAMSADGGKTFGSNVKVNNDSGSAGQYSPAIALDSAGNIYVVWVDNRNSQNWDIYFAKSTDGGSSFGGNVRVDDDGSGAKQYSPAIALDANKNIYVVWRDRRSGNDDIRLAKSTNGGTSFNPSVRVDDDASGAEQDLPSIAVDATGKIYVAWSDYRLGHYDIYFAKSENGGATFGANVRVDATGGSAYKLAPFVVADPNGDVYVMWQDDRDCSDVSGNMDIYFASSHNSGASFTGSIRVNDSEAGSAAAYDPVMSVGNSRFIYASWTDGREGSDDIYSSGTATNLNTTFAAGWNMFSVPRIPISTDPTKVFGDDIDPLYLHQLDATTGGYKLYPVQPISMTPGAGYWTKVDADTAVDVRGISTLQKDYAIHLLPGWNQVGEPFEFSVSWGNAKVKFGADTVDILTADVNGWLRKYLYWYEPATGGYDFAEAPNGKLDAWKGYLVQAFVECDLLVPPIEAPPAAPALVASSAGHTGGHEGTASKAPIWQIQLSARGGGRSDMANFLGVASDASDGFDRADAPEPPPIESFVSLYFPHTDWGNRAGKYTRDIKREDGNISNADDEGIKWTAELYTDLKNTEINIAWNDLSQAPKEYGLLFMDVDTNKTVDMRKENGYIFNSETGALRHFMVAVSPKSANPPPQIEEIIIDGKIVGQEFVDGDYVSPTPTIEIVIIDDDLNSELSKAILMLSGREIETFPLVASTNPQEGQVWKPGLLEGGKYTLQIHAEDEGGNPPATQTVHFEIASELRIEKIVNYPNPMRDKTEFTYMLTRDAEVMIRIYTISGKLIRKLEDIMGTAGFNRTAWNGRDEDEDELANGVYLYKITAETDDEKVEEVEKLIIMR